MPWLSWFGRAVGLACQPGKPVQGFNLNKILKIIFRSLQSLTMLALLNGGCGRGIDPYLVGHTLYYSPRKGGFLHATSSTSFLEPGQLCMCQAETWRFGYYFLNFILKHLTFPRPFRYSVYNARLIYCLMLRDKFGLWTTSMGKHGQAWIFFTLGVPQHMEMEPSALLL